MFFTKSSTLVAISHLSLRENEDLSWIFNGSLKELLPHGDLKISKAHFSQRGFTNTLTGIKQY